MKIQWIWFLILWQFATGCAAVKGPQRKVAKMTSAQTMNGRYLNGTGDTAYYKDATLWGLLEFHVRKEFPEVDRAALVELEAKKRNKVIARLIVNGKIEQEKIIRGHVKQNYFFLRRKIQYFGLPFTVLFFRTYKCRLGISPDGILYGDMVHDQLGWILFFAAGHTERDSYSFPRR